MSDLDKRHFCRMIEGKKKKQQPRNKFNKKIGVKVKMKYIINFFKRVRGKEGFLQ